MAETYVEGSDGGVEVVVVGQKAALGGSDRGGKGDSEGGGGGRNGGGEVNRSGHPQMMLHSFLTMP